MSIPVVLLAVALASIPAPAGGCILLNGLLGADEWTEAGVVHLDPETELRFDKDDDNLFLAVVFLGPRHTGVDLYVQSRGRTRMLHVSSALGEKTLVDGLWSDYVWGENAWWSANVVGSIFEDGSMRFLEPAAFEFQMDRRELGPDLRLFVHLKRPEKSLPSGASVDASDEWLSLDIE